MRGQYRVVVLGNAKRMMDVHVKFLSNVSVPASKRLRATFASDVRSLSRMPYRYSYYKEPYRRMLSAKYYLIIYKIVGGTVYVEAIYDGRQA
ncbi:hypothetical protein FACS18949_09660 [Clostridia bacterium]|nr:hypothetical protein FACS18949_09660 [Clostridia bacterium]